MRAMLNPKDRAAVTSQTNNRVLWVDAMKLFACVLVVLGHLYMSFMAAGWISEDVVYYCLPIQAVYTFHVPLFFVCSGFLYQKKRAGKGIKSHLSLIKDKALNLGVPYVTFTVITLVLKMLFPDSVNNQATPLLQTLLLEPIAPYWYLYTLFLLFCLIPRQQSEASLIRLFAFCLILKVLYVLIPLPWSMPDAIGKVLSNAVWLAAGMLISSQHIRERVFNTRFAGIFLVLAIVLSVIFYSKHNDSRAIQFLVASFYVYSLTCMFVLFTGLKTGGFAAACSKYFMSVYVLHTITAAGVRSIALKLGVDQLPFHVVLGVLASFAIPLVVYEIACRRWWLLFWFEPRRALRTRDAEKTNV